MSNERRCSRCSTPSSATLCDYCAGYMSGRDAARTHALVMLNSKAVDQYGSVASDIAHMYQSLLMKQDRND